MRGGGVIAILPPKGHFLGPLLESISMLFLGLPKFGPPTLTAIPNTLGWGTGVGDNVLKLITTYVGRPKFSGFLESLFFVFYLLSES